MNSKSNHDMINKIWRTLDRVSTDLEKMKEDRKQAEADRKQAEADRKKSEAKMKADREADRKQAEADRKQEEVDRKKSEAKMKADREADRKKIEADREIDRKKSEAAIRERDKSIQRAEDLFITQWGKLVESLVEGDLINLLNSKGIDVRRTCMNETGFRKYIDKNGNEQRDECEIDIIAKNGEEIVVVEVKTTLRAKDVDRFVEVLELFPEMLPEYSGKKIYGAVAYLRKQDGANIRAEKKGLFVIRATGNSSSIINQESFKPKVF